MHFIFIILVSVSAVFAQVYSPQHNGVFLQNVGYCAYLCVRSSGELYSGVKPAF